MRSPAVEVPTPTVLAPGDLGRDQKASDPQPRSVAADLDRGQGLLDSHSTNAPVDLSPGQLHADTQPASAGGSLNGDHVTGEVHARPVAGSEGNDQPTRESHLRPVDPSDALLLILADSLNDVEGLRKATANQLHSLTRERDGKGGKGLSPYSRAAVMLADRLAVLEDFEHRTVLELQRAMRAHLLGPWVKRTAGIGEKQGARLIAAIGDPAWNHAESRLRRGPAELWAYCGYAPGQKRQKGVRSNWNAEAKMRAFLCAESCIKQTGGADGCTTSKAASRRRSPYRDVYDAARANWADRDTSDGHKHAHALRCVAKAILKDLWREARTAVVATPETDPFAPTAEEPA